MATFDLMNIYNDIYSKKVAYCALCYKSEVETTLLHSKVYKKVIESLKYSEMFLQNEKLCYMCEGRMKSFTQLMDQLQLALEVQRIYMRADMCTKYRRNLMQRTLDKCQSEFTTFRRRKQLHKTNVLVIDSNVVPPKTPEPKVDQTHLPPTNPEIETVIINEKDPLASNFESNKEKNPIDFPIILPNTHFVLTIGPDKNLYMVPKPNIPNGDIDHNTTDTNLKQTQDDNKKRLNHTKTQETTNSQKTLKTDKQTNNSPITQNLQTTEVKKRSQNEKPIEKRPKTTNLPLIVDCRTDESAFDKINKESVVEGVQNINESRVPDVVKHPIRNASEVDWEDKIPMEVISFGE